MPTTERSQMVRRSRTRKEPFTSSAMCRRAPERVPPGDQTRAPRRFAGNGAHARLSV